MNQSNQIKLISILILILFNTIGVAQEVDFNKLNAPDGGNFGFVTGITQDIDGNMWFTTKQGLLKYNGSQISSYQNKPLNTNSVISNNLEAVYADKDGSIWVGSLGSGLDRLDPKTGVFTHFQHDPDNPGSISNDTVTTILRDKLGDLYVGTHGGLNKYNSETNQFTHFRHDFNDPKSISNNQVRVLYESKNGTIWIGTGSPYGDNGGGPEDGGLNKFNKESGTFTSYLHDPNNKSSLANNKISAIYEDNDGMLWIGTAKNRIHKMNKDQGTFERLTYDLKHPENLSVPDSSFELPVYEHITFITQDSAGNFWYGTLENGVYNFDAKQSKINKYMNSENLINGLEGTGAWTAFNSREGMFWLGGIFPGNIYRINPDKIEIGFYPIEDGTSSLYQESNGDLWIGTGNNIIIKKKNGETFKRIINKIELVTQENQWAKIFGEDKKGNIWVGGLNGLNLWDKKNNNFIQYFNNPDDNKSLSHNEVLSFLSDSKNNLWVGTLHGLNLFDQATGKASRIFLRKRDTVNVGLNIISDVFEDRKNRLWVGVFNGGGVFLLDPETKTGKNYLNGIDALKLHQDKSGLLWIGTSDGLYWYSEKDDVFLKFTNPFLISGIPEITSILEDDEQYLWVTSRIGLVQINPKRDQISIFDYNFGVNSYDFNWDSGYKDPGGRLYFGNVEGYFLIDPNVLNNEIKPPEIRITGFRLTDEYVMPDENGPLKEPLSEAKELELGFDQNVFSFDFATIDYTNPENNRIIYFLENYDKNWSISNAENRAYYFNIPPGNYTFHIKGSKGYGPWAEKQINIIISPPWWKTLWAYISYVLVFALAIFSFDRFMRKRLVRIERERTREKDIKQAKEIEKAYTKLKSTQSQLVQSEKMASLGELTAGIAHEIQNPLNFVNNFSEVNTELLEELEEEVKKGNLVEIKTLAKDIKSNEKKIIQHGKRADAIVKGMLQHSRTSSGKKELTDINALTDEFLRLAYHGLRAKDKSFNAKMETQFDPSLGKVNIVAQDVGRVILNLINNAFYAVNDRKKQKEEGYEPTVIAGTKKLGDHLEISVTDNGKGIPSEIKDKIFQPFFTSKPTGEGTGLGLSLSYDIVKAHGGELKVETKEGEGTEFIIELPMQIS